MVFSLCVGRESVYEKFYKLNSLFKEFVKKSNWFFFMYVLYNITLKTYQVFKKTKMYTNFVMMSC